MFDQIAGRYDLLNRLLSVGMDARWRRSLVAALRLPPDGRVLDVATGTGDVALAVLRKHPRARLAAVDPSGQMLRIARDKLAAADHHVTLARGDARALPCRSGAFDALAMAFGIRNIPERPQALREMRRVLRPGGRVAILELATPSSSFLHLPARAYVERVVPWVGARLSAAGAYRHLERSMSEFPAPDLFAAEMERAGLRVRRVSRLGLGVCLLFVGEAA